MKREMLINVLQPEECRIAILENGVLEELYVERTGHESYVGNIYKGRIVNIEPSIQAAFVDFGVGRNGFLHVSDVEAAYYRHLTDDRDPRSGRDRDRDRDRDQNRGRPSRGSRPNADIPPQQETNNEDDNVFVRDLDSQDNLSDEMADKLFNEMEEIADDLETSPALLEMEAQDEADYAWDSDTNEDDDDDDNDEGQSSFGAGIWDDDDDDDDDDEEPPVDTSDEPNKASYDYDDEEDDYEEMGGQPSIAELAMFVTTGQLKPNESAEDSEESDDPVALQTAPDDADSNQDDANASDGNTESADTESDVSVAEMTPDEGGTEEEESKPKRKPRTSRAKKSTTSKTGTTRKRTTRSRKKPEPTEGDTPEVSDSSDETNSDDAPTQTDGEQSRDDTDEQPKPMDSAERRTHEDDPEREPLEAAGPGNDDNADVHTIAEGDNNPLFPSAMGNAMTNDSEPATDNRGTDFSDIDLSFSMSRAPEPEPQSEPEPQPQAESTESETDTEMEVAYVDDSAEDTVEEAIEEAIEVEECDVIDESPEDDNDSDDSDDDPDVTVMDLEDAVDDLLEEYEEAEEEERTHRRREQRPRGNDNRGGDNRRGDNRRGDNRRGDNRRGNGGNNNGHRGGRPGMIRPKPLIQDIFKKGQEVLVQVIKEGLGTKGPTLSTYISIAGRYLVLMPGLNRIGVSRKITDEEQRRRLRDILNDLKPPKGLGFIIRTAGLDRTKKELQRDLAYLSKLWQVVVRRIRKFKAPAEIYQESDMITRTIRDTFTNDIQTIYVDETRAFEHAQEFLQIVMPRYAARIRHYQGSEPIFHKYGIESEIARIHQRHVPLPNGGSIVIDQTEALVAIDVNSGNFRADNNAEETAYQMNLLAAREIARQLRLRDLGGVIVNDFIDMRDERHRRNVERAMREAVRRDRARTKVLRISQFGIIEMTRQRIRPSLKRSVYQDCPHCNGSGQVKTCESVSIEVMRMLQLASTRDTITQIHVRVQNDVANYLHNRKRTSISNVENNSGTSIHVEGVLEVPPEWMEFRCYDNNNNEIHFPPHEEPRHHQRRRHPERQSRY